MTAWNPQKIARQVFLAAAIAANAGEGAAADQKPKFDPPLPVPNSAFLMIGPKNIVPPQGHVDFCKRKPAQARHANDVRHPGDCDFRTKRPGKIKMSPDVMHTMFTTNFFVNRDALPGNDKKEYGTSDYWTYPKSYADCEDYTLRKRRLLIERGWDPSALLIAIVDDDEKDNIVHAVLVVRTTEGDFIMDNLKNEILTPDRAGYKFLSILSPFSGEEWMEVRARGAGPSPVPPGPSYRP